MIDDEEEASCNRKVKHDSKFSALQEAARLALENEDSFTAYECNLCQNYHVGSVKYER